MLFAFDDLRLLVDDGGVPSLIGEIAGVHQIGDLELAPPAVGFRWSVGVVFSNVQTSLGHGLVVFRAVIFEVYSEVVFIGGDYFRPASYPLVKVEIHFNAVHFVPFLQVVSPAHLLFRRLLTL